MVTIRNTVVYPLLLISMLLLFATVARPAHDETPQSVLNSIRYWKDPNYTRIVIDLNSPVTFREKYLPNPDRLFIDLHNTIMGNGINPIQISDGVVTQVRAGQFDKETARVVIELNARAGYKILPLSSPDRLVIDVLRDTAPPAMEHKQRMEKDDNNNIIIPGQTIVIDAGHGGKDPGAIGRSGLKEKDIVLDVALRLRKLVKEKLGVNVIMTRDTDVFIPLEERTAIANTRGADFFVSVHANSSRRAGAKGVETYLLGRATDRDAMATAERENNATEKSLNTLQLILTDLLNTAKKEESLRLAHYVQENMIGHMETRYKVTDLGVKQAPFYVLVNARMPSILAEISFISNPEEEKLLADADHRQEIAEAILKGIRKYIQATPLLAQPKEANYSSLQ
ncbi:MAG: N-acetylmuramoyl-L-alanine amidase [Nitrospirae bacterium]|nr:N-acetylmuramoyl-L-alanine amidase [Nitrospirota bacterium]